MDSADKDEGSLTKALIWLLIGSALIAFASLSFFVAFSTFGILWADYQDSPASTYLMVGGIELGVALVSGALGIRFFTWGYRRIR